MKSILLGILVIAAIVSCKKNAATCETGMADISGSYKITKCETVAYNSGTSMDVTDSLTSCEFAATYQFNIDSTAIYTEPAGCHGNGNGIWSVTGSAFNASFATGNGSRIGQTIIASWDCKNLVLTTMYPSAIYNYRFTLSKL